MKKIILIGPPGSGKGTQAQRITKEYNIPHISTGDIFRDNIKNETELGKKAKEIMDKGNLVPDEITIDMVKHRLEEADCKDGFLLDGFPRTIPQAEALDKVQKIDEVLDIEVPDADIIERITGRRQGSDGVIYHTKYSPPPEGVEVTQRKDDTEEVVKNRLEVYHQQTEPIISHYKKQGVVLGIDGTHAIDKVWDEVKHDIDDVDHLHNNLID